MEATHVAEFAPCLTLSGASTGSDWRVVSWSDFVGLCRVYADSQRGVDGHAKAMRSVLQLVAVLLYRARCSILRAIGARYSCNGNAAPDLASPAVLTGDRRAMPALYRHR